MGHFVSYRSVVVELGNWTTLAEEGSFSRIAPLDAGTVEQFHLLQVIAEPARIRPDLGIWLLYASWLIRMDNALARLFGSVLVATTVAWSQVSLAVCGWGDDELLFLFTAGAFNYSIDASGQFRLGATKITFGYGSSTWINACNASSEPGRADAVAGANKAAYLSLRAYRSLVDPSDHGVEVARTGTLLLHVWDPAPAISR